jgi:hypothetical protein
MVWRLLTTSGKHMKFNVAEGSGNARIAGWRPSQLGIAFEGIAIRLAGPEHPKSLDSGVE